MPISFAHIAPVKCLQRVADYDVHLLLAHLIEDNKEYRDFYINLKQTNPSVFYHLDNSAFEMFKRGEPMYPSDKLIEMGKLVGADSIVLTDYPKEPWQKTVESAVKLMPTFRRAGFMTFFCPQSELGDIEGLMSSFKWAIEEDDINFIGVSILACPIGMGINEGSHSSSSGRDDGYRLQRYLSRLMIFRELEKRGLLVQNDTFKRFHCLGMTDGPREIDLLREYHDYIFSWDSSAAIWHGIQQIRFDDSPTGLRNGKCEKEVDFNCSIGSSSKEWLDIDAKIMYNMQMIDKMCQGE
jgi:hypothetical protein